MESNLYAWTLFCVVLGGALILWIFLRKEEPIPVPIVSGWGSQNNWPVPFTVRYRYSSSGPWTAWIHSQSTECWPMFVVPARVNGMNLQREVQSTGTVSVVATSLKTGSSVMDATPMKN